MSIQVLPPQLANQIAAGEVVERPASVVKELVENSLDAGATRIDIDIERGGAKLIRIRDNGCGISKDDLGLALARHATSKITTLDDLEAIISLGFRGEALASISSVSRLTLTSCTAEQTEAWQAYAEGREMAVTIKPAAHPVGSTLEVLDLFYNTPARRKFMRTEKTEFNHIDEIVRRIALARFDVAINLSHNGKMVRQYRAVTDPAQHERRLASICGPAFVQQALRLSWQHDDLNIHGWVAQPSATLAASELQYCYVNSRMMRDRLINHAIRQAYQDRLPGEQQPAYVLYLDVDPHQVDVNVHPAKHEVRFHQARLVHDFIYQAVSQVLEQSADSPLPLSDNAEPAAAVWQQENRPAAGGNHFAQPPKASSSSAPRSSGSGSNNGAAREPVQPTKRTFAAESYPQQEGDLYRQLLQPAAEPAPLTTPPTTPLTTPPLQKNAPVPQTAPLAGHQHSFGRVVMICPPCYAVVEQQHKLNLLALPVAERWLKKTQLDTTQEALRPQPLLIPLTINLQPAEVTAFNRHQELLTRLGMVLTLAQQRATLHAVPLPLRQQNLQKLIPNLLGYLSESAEVLPETLATWLARHLGSEHAEWNMSQAIQLLADVERLCPKLVKSPPAGFLQPIDLSTAMAALQHD